MGKMGKFDCKGFIEFQKQLEKLQDTQDQFVESCAKELAARLLRMVVKRTPVGEYNNGVVEFDTEIPAGHVKFDTRDGKHVSFDTRARKKHVKFMPHTGKNGGTLRRAWSIGEIRKEGNVYKIDIMNSKWYSVYVEHGHRTPNHKKWVKGQFMMTISEQELEKIAPKVLENRIKKYLEGFLK